MNRTTQRPLSGVATHLLGALELRHEVGCTFAPRACRCGRGGGDEGGGESERNLERLYGGVFPARRPAHACAPLACAKIYCKKGKNSLVSRRWDTVRKGASEKNIRRERSANRESGD